MFCASESSQYGKRVAESCIPPVLCIPYLFWFQWNKTDCRHHFQAIGCCCLQLLIEPFLPSICPALELKHRAQSLRPPSSAAVTQKQTSAGVETMSHVKTNHPCVSRPVSHADFTDAPTVYHTFG